MQQFILPFNIPPNYLLSDFIISKCNEQAFSIINSWPCNWGVKPYEYILLLYAPPSSGKTHLAHIWQEKSKGLFASSLKDFDYQKNFIIEDAEKWEAEELFHFFNLVQEHKNYLLITTSIKKINFSLKDLNSRLNSLQQIEIKSIDDHLMKTLLFKHFATHSVKISSSVIDYLAKHLPRNFSEIKRLTDEINQFAITKGRTITIPLLKEVLTAQK